MEIKRIGSQASAQGPAEYVTGTVRIDCFSALRVVVSENSRAMRERKSHLTIGKIRCIYTE